MMLKEKSNPWARLKYLYVLPLAAIAVTAFARPEISEKWKRFLQSKLMIWQQLWKKRVKKMLLRGAY